MGFLIPDDPGYNPEIRETGFRRYQQCLSFYAAGWMKANLITVLSALPLLSAITVSVLSSSVLLLLPASFLCGMLFGPFLAGMVDAILRGLRDDGANWREAYRKSWRQNWKESLLPGGVLGLLSGVYAFMAALLWWSRIPPTAGTLALYGFAGFLLMLITALYWPQLVLFRQKNGDRLRNIVLFSAKYLWRVSAAALLLAACLLLFVLFAPWSLLLLPLTGFWYPLFLALLLLYDPLNRELRIEERLAQEMPK